MTKLSAGSQVQAGYYFNPSSWTIHPVPADGGTLPGEAGQQWISIPMAVALGLTPVLGLAFLMFLPFIGFYLTAEAASRPLLRVFRHEAAELAATMSPGWRPGEAHLTGKREETSETPPGPAAQDDELERLAREIEARRGEKK